MKKIVWFVLPVLLVLDVIMASVLQSSGEGWLPPQMTAASFVADVSAYPVRGVDLSEYQGNVDWEVLSKQDIDFAYIKATKGHDYQDKKFGYNWENAHKTDLKVGAYHLFTYDTPALFQFLNFINTVPKHDDSLPPAIDVELYGEQRDNPPESEQAIKTLGQLLSLMEWYYGKKPVLYATSKAYNLYIKDQFKDNPLWIRNPKEEPTLPGNREWTFWQYNNDGELKGYSGENRFIDLNVFNGTPEDFERLF